VIAVYRGLILIDRKTIRVNKLTAVLITISSLESNEASGTALAIIPAAHRNQTCAFQCSMPTLAHGGLPDALRTQTCALDAWKPAWGHSK
jgi:hypothetical protein